MDLEVHGYWTLISFSDIINNRLNDKGEFLMEENKILARVSNKEITQKDVNLLLESLGPERAMQFYSEDGMKRLLDELINQELFYLDAVSSGVEKEEEFIAELELVKNNVLKQYSIRRLLNNIKIEAKDAAEYYENNKEQFRSPESARASHILVDSEEKAKEILEEIGGGLSFGDAAMKYSQCPSKSNGGDLGDFTRGKMVPEFENAAFAMTEGEVSEPVKTQFGYHIIKLTKKNKEEIKSFDEVEEQLLQHLTALKQNEVYSNKAEELKEKYDVTII